MRGDEFFQEIAARPPLTKLHPRVASFLKNYLAGEKIIPFGDKRVINTQFPPYPGRAFESLLGHFLVDAAPRLYSVTLAVTNRCRFRCWHCYNAGRSGKDLPLEVIRKLAPELQDRGAAIVTLTGGEPLLRKDLGEICRAFDDRSCLIVGTTGAGLTHLYIDGSGELCPCNLVPLSFGNVAREPLGDILRRMGRHFVRPRPSCVGRILTRFTDGGPLPLRPESSESLCEAHLPDRHPLPLFYRTRQGCGPSAGNPELADAYDRIHGQYDEFWLSAAGRPVRELVAKMDLKGSETVFEAGCGSGFGTALLARKLGRGGRVIAADISAGMLDTARRRLASRKLSNADFLLCDAVEALSGLRGLDAVFTSWVLGYIPLRPFFAAAAKALSPGGRLALIVHRENSPREEFEIFSSLVARDPRVMTRRVAFDFPRDGAHLKSLVDGAGLAAVDLWEGSAVFRYGTAGEVLDHLLKSGAGTVFYDAIDRSARDRLTCEFLEILRKRNGKRKTFQVRHDYVACIAERK